MLLAPMTILAARRCLRAVEQLLLEVGCRMGMTCAESVVETLWKQGVVLLVVVEIAASIDTSAMGVALIVETASDLHSEEECTGKMAWLDKSSCRDS